MTIVHVQHLQVNSMVFILFVSFISPFGVFQNGEEVVQALWRASWLAGSGLNDTNLSQLQLMRGVSSVPLTRAWKAPPQLSVYASGLTRMLQSFRLTARRFL